MDDEEINITEINIGCQGSGKSWEAMQRAAEIAAEWDCPIVIHNCGSAAIKKKKNPYYEADWKEYFHSATMLDAKGKAMDAEIPRIAFPPDILVVTTGYADDALIYADMVRRGKEVVVLIDEVSAAKSITPQNIGEPWRTRIAQRRAMKTALIICMQYPTMASRFATGTATRLKVFKLDNEDDIKVVVGSLRFPKESAELIPNLKRGQYIEKSQGFEVE